MDKTNHIQVLQDVRNLMIENIIPRLAELDAQLDMLRRATWPTCQALCPTNDARVMLSMIHKEDAVDLITKKAKASRWLSQNKVVPMSKLDMEHEINNFLDSLQQ